LVAATSWNWAGYETEPSDRVIQTRPSSSGCRSACSAPTGNSASSSRHGQPSRWRCDRSPPVGALSPTCRPRARYPPQHSHRRTSWPRYQRSAVCGASRMRS